MADLPPRGDGSRILADEVLPLIRTRKELYRWHVANQHGGQMHQAIDILEAAFDTSDPAEVYTVTHKAVASAMKVIAKADDSSGIIGDACRRLLALHPRAAAASGTAATKLVAWMMKFQLEDAVDFFDLDPVAYAPALGGKGLAAYRARLEEVRQCISPDSKDSPSHPFSRTRWVLEFNDRRLAVLDRDVEAIIRTHARDRRVPAWFTETALALEEIGEVDLAINWAEQATFFHHGGHQSLQAADYWCRLLAQHRPVEELDARLRVLRCWPSSSTATALHKTAGRLWPDYRDEVLGSLEANPRDAVLFTLLTLKEVESSWELAHSLDLRDADAWDHVAKAYAKVDRLAVLPIHRRLVEAQLIETGAQHYRLAARRLATMRKLAEGTEASAGVDEFIRELRAEHRRRPRLQQEFTRARLP